MPTVFVFDTQYFLEWIGNPHDWDPKLHEMAYWVEFVFQTKDQHLAANDAFTTLVLGIGMGLMGEDIVNEPGQDPDDRFEGLATQLTFDLPRPIAGIATWQRWKASLIEKNELMGFPYKRDTILMALDLEHNDHFNFPFQCRHEVGCDGRRGCRRSEITELGIAYLCVNDIFEKKKPPGMFGEKWRDDIVTRTWRVKDVPTNSKNGKRENLDNVFNQGVPGSKNEIFNKSDVREAFLDFLRDLARRNVSADVVAVAAR